MPIIEGASSRPFSSDGAPTDGDFNGQANPGAVCTDTTTGTVYSNTGTRDATVWTLVGPAA